MDLTAIASAIAERFGADLMTPPTGYSDPGTSTHLMPTAITTMPTCVVFPPEGAFSFASYMRTGSLAFPVRFYLSDAADLPRSTLAMYDWAGVLLERVRGRYDLDLSGVVTHAVIDGMRFGRMEYGGQEYTGIELSVVVHTEEPYMASSLGGFTSGFSGGYDT